MPSFDIVLTIGQHENVAAVIPSAGRYWPIKFFCLECDVVSKNYIFVDPWELHESNKGGMHHCVFKCGSCRYTITADVKLVNVSGAVDVAKAAESGHEAEGVVARLEVRGGEPVEAQLDNQWNVEAASGAIFKMVDISNDWCEYDEKGKVTLALSDISIKFRKSKVDKK